MVAARSTVHKRIAHNLARAAAALTELSGGPPRLLVGVA
jgi:hypothetical protein